MKLPINFSDSWSSHVSAIRDGQVYATRAGNANSEYLYALRATDGAVLWRSQGLIDEYAESPSFAANGDIIVGNSRSLLRISHTDGTTVWTTPRFCPASGSCGAAVAGDRIYAWEFHYSLVAVSAFNAATGALLYSSDPVFQTASLNGVLAGPNGMVYAPMADGIPADAFVALQDTGSALVERWRVPMGFTASASFGVGPDGTVYSYSADGRVLRLDPADGTILNSSAPISEGYGVQARMAIDADGKVFVTIAGGGTVFSFNADLTLQWSDEVPYAGGPAIGQLGVLIVCGEADVRAYSGANLPASRTAARRLRSGRVSIRAPAVSSRANAPARAQKAPGATHAPLVAVPAAR